MSGVLEESQKNRNSILAWLGGTKSKKKAKKRETWSLFSFSATSGSDSLGLKNETEDSRLRSSRTGLIAAICSSKITLMRTHVLHNWIFFCNLPCHVLHQKLNHQVAQLSVRRRGWSGVSKSGRLADPSGRWRHFWSADMTTPYRIFICKFDHFQIQFKYCYGISFRLSNHCVFCKML